MLKTKKGILFQCLCGLFFLICIIGTVSYVRSRVYETLNADAASEFVLGKLLAEEGGVISKNWYYSTELRVVNTNLVYPVFFRMTDSWHRVRILSMAVLYMLASITYFGMSRAYKFKKFFLLSAAVLFIPFSVLYYKTVLKGLYYLPHIIITFLVLMLSELFLKLDGWKAYAVLVASAVFSFFFGLGGARQMQILYIPLLLASLVSVIGEKSGHAPKKWLAFSLSVFAGNAAGFLINFTVLAKNYHFSSWGDVAFTGIDLSRLTKTLNGILFAYGYTAGNVFSMSFVRNVICAGWIFLTVFAVYYALKNEQKCSGEYVRLALFSVCLFAVYILFYLLTNAAYADRYALLIIVLSLPLTALLAEQAGADRKIFSVLLPVLVLMTAVSGGIYYHENRNVSTSGDYRKISKFLISEDYYNGYSSFWHANVLTELSGGKIDVWSIASSLAFEKIEDIDQTYHWLQYVRHDTEHPSGKIFLLFNKLEYQYNMWNKTLAEDDIIYRSNDFVIYGFEDYGDLIDTLYPGYNFVFGDGDGLENGRDTDGHRELYAGGVSFGPRQTFWPGIYEVTVKGQGLENAFPSFRAENGTKEPELSMTGQSETELRYSVSFAEKIFNGETVIRNMSDASGKTVILDSISIRRIPGSYPLPAE